MSITIHDVRDLIQVLREHPDWRAEFERALLGEELLSLPAIVRELAEAQKRTEARVEELAEAQKRTEAQIAALTLRMDELASRMDALTRVTEMMRGDIGDLRGKMLEIQYTERVPAYVSDFFRRARVIPRQEFLAQLEEAEEHGKISSQERKDASLVDLLVRGQRLPDRAQAFLTVEVSATIHLDDVERAARRAEIFSRVFPIVMPVVGGQGITAEARERADSIKVKITLDGVTLEPRPEA